MLTIDCRILNHFYLFQNHTWQLQNRDLSLLARHRMYPFNTKICSSIFWEQRELRLSLVITLFVSKLKTNFSLVRRIPPRSPLPMEVAGGGKPTTVDGRPIVVVLGSGHGIEYFTYPHHYPSRYVLTYYSGWFDS